MIRIVQTINLYVLPSRVWSHFGAFKAIGDWHPAVSSVAMSVVNGLERRTLTLADGAFLIEDRIDDGSDPLSYEYRIVEGPLPVANYTSRFSVAGDKTGSQITWSGSFKPVGVENVVAEAVVTSIYKDGLNAIAGCVSSNPLIFNDK